MSDAHDMDTLLVAYADGELDQATTASVETYLTANPDAQRILAIHRETASLLRAAFPERLYERPEAAPLAFSTPPASLTPASLTPAFTAPHALPARRRAALAPRFGWAIAASILMGMAGYGAGVSYPGLLQSDRDRMLSDVAEYHAVYSRETVHLVEVPASQSDHLKMWLGKRVNRSLVIPDFKEAGLTFAGGRMVVVDGRPVAELMYTREKGLPIAFCVLNAQGNTPSPIVEARRGALNMATWDDPSHAYVVVGEAPSELIHTLATSAQKQL